MLDWLKSIFHKTHVHSWEGSCWNKFSVEMERTCRGCGIRQHHRDFADSRDNVWRDGPNEYAEELRASGKVQNY